MAQDGARPDEESLRERFDKVVQERAKRLGVSPEAAGEVPNETPLFREAAEALGRTEGVSADALLDSYRTRVDESASTSECWKADDLDAYVALGEVSEAKRTHLDGCDACAALVFATQPSEVGLSRFADEVRAILRDPLVKAAEAVRPATAAEPAKPARAKRATRLILAPIPAFAGALLAVLLWSSMPQAFSLGDRVVAKRSAAVVAFDATSSMARTGDLVEQITALQRSADEATEMRVSALVEQVNALQRSVDQTTQVAARAELAARDARSAQTALAANQAEAVKRLLTNLEEYKKVTLVAPYVWNSKRFQKGDVISSGQLTNFSGAAVLMVEDPTALNEVRGEVVRSMKEVGLEPAK